MNYFEELTGKKYFFVKYDNFYWNNVKKEPLCFCSVPSKEINELLLSPSIVRPHAWASVQTQDVEINDEFTLNDFLNKNEGSSMVFCLNEDSIFYYKKIYSDLESEAIEKKYIKVFIDYKN